MYKIYIRVNGEKKELPKPEGQGDFLLDKIIQELNFSFDFEINLCNEQNLGNELFYDPRLENKLKYENKERLNKTVAGKTYPDLNLCYICYSNIAVLFWKTILHELHHFQDPYECSEDDYLTPMEEGNYIEPKKYVKTLISSHLNDFFAEYFAINKLIELYNKRKKWINLIVAIDYNLAYLKENEKNAKEQIFEAIKNDTPDFEKKITIIYFIHHNIIKLVFYFLSFYRAFSDNGFNTILYENRWNKFISEEISPPLGILLNKLKDNILDSNLDLLKDKVELRKRINKSVIEFYKNEITDYLSKVFKEKAKESPFSFLREIAQSMNIANNLNLEWMIHLRQVLSNFQLGWIRQLQQIQKSLIEPLSHITELAHMIKNIKPNLGTIINDEDEEQDNLEDE